MKYLTTDNATSSIDSNGLTKWTIPLSANFTTEFDISNSTNTISLRAYSSAADGSGTLTLQYSNDRINWETVTDDSGANVTWTIDGTDTDGIDIKNPAVGWYRMNYTKGTNTAGTIVITVAL